MIDVVQGMRPAKAHAPALRGSLFSAQHNARKVARHPLERTGSTYRALEEEFVSSEHPDFHPSDVLESPDGSLLVIDTGGWLSGRTVLLSTAWLSSVAPEKRLIVVNMEKKRIEEAPLYETGADIPREYETRLHDYYGFPYYWQQ